MSYLYLRKIKSLYFTYNEVADTLEITNDSARVICSRYVAKNLLIRIKRNVYALQERWKCLDETEIMQIANIIQVPSYISLTTALSYYGYTTQIQQNYIESICVNKTFYKNVDQVEFNYTKISKQYYFDFNKLNGVFIASPEKALLDALYLASLGRYSLDFSALETSKFDKEKLRGLFTGYPKKTNKLWGRHASA
ncbi:MAG: hypothetical protein JRF40_09865 [Deltaproteobacteria bacterium]|nr:hypothetical protein [Deltaproteobacteria bacterium]